MWGLYVDPAKLRNAEDFGLRFGGAPLNWADQHGVCSLIYTEPWGWWLPWTAVGTPGERRPPPSTAEATARLLEATRADAGEDGGFMLPYVPKAEIARAVLNSCPEDAAGQPDPCSGLGWSALGSSTWLLHCLANPDPEILPLPNRASVTRERIVAPYFRQGESRGVRAGGVYIDSVGAGRVGLWGSENYRRAHWRVTGQPLAFNPVSRRPCQVYALSAYDFLRPLAADLRQRGGLLFCNLGGVRALTFLGPVFDLIGREGDCEFPGVSYLGGFDDLDRMYACLHVLSGSRPVSFYDYDWWQPGFDPGGRERRLRLCLFHGVFPGLPWDEAGAVTAAEGLRPVLRRYLPAIERVAQAGWEPVTGAAADGAGVCVERYGDGRRGNLHFTLRNPTALPCRTRLVLDAGEVGIAPEPPALVALDVLRLEPLPLTASRSGYAVDLSLPAEGTTAVALGSPETVARPLVRAAAERLGLITDVAAFAPAHERQPSLDLRPGWYPDRVHNEGGSQVMEDDTLLDLRGRPALRLATGPGNARCVCFAGPWDLRFEQGRPYELLLRCQPPPKRMADGIQPLLSVRLGFEEYFGRGLDDRLCEFPLAAGSAGQWQRVAFTMPDGAYRAFVSFVLAGEKAEAWLLDLRLAPADAADSVLAGLQGATPAEDAWLARELTPGLTRARAQLREAASRPAVPVIEAVQGQLTQLADELRRRWPPGPDLRQTEAWQRLEDARTGLRAALAILGRAGP
jgi:hypothetical protein